MARKAVVNKDIALSMLRKGETTQNIAEHFEVSRQAIDIYRRDFINKGLLSNKRAARARKTSKEVTPQKEALVYLKQFSPSKDIVSLDEQIDLLINAFQALKRLPQLEKDIELYKQQYENANKEIEKLKQIEKKRLDQESRWLLTQCNNTELI